MNTLVLERSTAAKSEALLDDAGNPTAETIDRILVGIGPGSFAGVRSALAYAQGYAIGSGCEVVGLPSPCACATEGAVAVVGDARRGLFWIALFDGFRLVTPVFQVVREDLTARIPLSVPVYSPDEARIGATLKELFADRYHGMVLPTAEGLHRFARHNPAALITEPLPLYLNPAVRND